MIKVYGNLEKLQKLNNLVYEYEWRELMMKLKHLVYRWNCRLGREIEELLKIEDLKENY